MQSNIYKPESQQSEQRMKEMRVDPLANQSQQNDGMVVRMCEWSCFGEQAQDQAVRVDYLPPIAEVTLGLAPRKHNRRHFS
jgi:hypothetical protein